MSAAGDQPGARTLEPSLRIAAHGVRAQVAASYLNASFNCDLFAAEHETVRACTDTPTSVCPHATLPAQAHYDRESFVGLAWRPAGEAVCSEMYSTSKTNLPGSVRLHDLQESWARMFPVSARSSFHQPRAPTSRVHAQEMARYTNKSDKICARVPQYLKDAQRGSAKKRKAPAIAPPAKRPSVSAWSGLVVEGASISDATTLGLDEVDIDLDDFDGL